MNFTFEGAERILFGAGLPCAVERRRGSRVALLHQCSRTKIRRRILALAFALLSLVHAVAAEPVVTESEMKAAFILNFPKYIDWPPGAFADPASPMIILFLGDCPAAKDFRRMAEGKHIGGHPVEFRQATSAADFTNCHVLFVGASEPREIAEALSRVRDAAVLTVGDTPEFFDKGGIIYLAQRDRRIRLEINLRAARQANLKISSKLLSVADSVKGK